MKPIIDDDALDNFSPYEAEAMLKTLNEIYKDGTVHERPPSCIDWRND